MYVNRYDKKAPYTKICNDVISNGFGGFDNIELKKLKINLIVPSVEKMKKNNDI